LVEHLLKFKVREKLRTVVLLVFYLTKSNFNFNFARSKKSTLNHDVYSKGIFIT